MHLYGRKNRELQNGPPVPEVDENYLRESILNPHAKIAAGGDFATNGRSKMSEFQGQLSEREVLGLIEFIKSIK